MPPSKNPTLRLRHILDEAEAIRLATEGVAFESFRVEALRNVLRHEYQDVDPKVLWRIVREQLPILATTVRKELGEIET